MEIEPLIQDKPQVFISYAHVDRPKAELLSRALRGFGYSVWWDHALLGGDDFRTRIAQKIYDASVVLVLFSESSINSGWVLDEAGRADQANKLVPVRIDNVDVPLGFGHLQRCDLIDWNDDFAAKGFDDILAAVERFTGQPRKASFTEPDVPCGETGEPETKPQMDRFSLKWKPVSDIRSIIVVMIPVYLIALLVSIIMASPGRAGVEWIRLLHVYTSTLTLGGGIFLTLVFRLADRAPTPTERAAITDVARSLFSSWRFAALAQFVTGFLLIIFKKLVLDEWLIQSIILYLFALYFWWIGFGHALRAAKYDTLYQVGDHITEYRRLRDQRLLIAIILTAWVLITMIYRHDADLACLLNKLLQFDLSYPCKA